MTEQPDLTCYRIAVVQMDTVPTQIDANREHAVELARVAIDRGARLIVFPELCDVDEIEGAFEYATTVPGTFTAPFERLAADHDVHFIVGMARRVGDDLYNSAVFIGPQGILGAYDKVHPWSGHWDEEADDWAEDPRRIEPYNYLPGDGFRVFSIDGISVGAMICYDGQFPESWICNRLLGADVVVWPTNRGSYRDMDVPALSRFFQLIVVAANRFGQSSYWTQGDSMVIDIEGNLLAHAYNGECVLLADLDIEAARRRRRGLPFMRDRRPELYGRILQPAPSEEMAPGIQSCQVARRLPKGA